MVTSWPLSRSRQAAVRPPSDPPTTATRARFNVESARLAEGGDLVDPALEEDAALFERRIAQAVFVALADVLLPDAVQLLGHPGAVGRIVLERSLVPP